MDTLRVATARSLAYVPQFAAEHLGLFAEEDLAVRFVYGPASAKLADHVGTGRADLVLGSLWFAASSTNGQLVPRIQLNAQCRYFVFGRPEAAGRTFRWSDLSGRRVLMGMAAPTPWVALREILHRAQVSIDEILINPGLSPDEAVAQFGGGVADYLLTDGEAAIDPQLIELASFADGLGPVPWSVYSGPRAASSAAESGVAKFARALARAQDWVYAAAASEVGKTVEEAFPDIPSEARERIVERYRRIRLWAPTTKLDVVTADRWMRTLWRWGLLSQELTVADLTGSR